MADTAGGGGGSGGVATDRRWGEPGAAARSSVQQDGPPATQARAWSVSGAVVEVPAVDLYVLESSTENAEKSLVIHVK